MRTSILCGLIVSGLAGCSALPGAPETTAPGEPTSPPASDANPRRAPGTPPNGCSTNLAGTATLCTNAVKVDASTTPPSVTMTYDPWQVPAPSAAASVRVVWTLPDGYRFITVRGDGVWLKDDHDEFDDDPDPLVATAAGRETVATIGKARAGFKLRRQVGNPVNYRVVFHSIVNNKPDRLFDCDPRIVDLNASFVSLQAPLSCR